MNRNPQCGFHWDVSCVVEYPKFERAKKACILAIEKWLSKNPVAPTEPKKEQ